MKKVITTSNAASALNILSQAVEKDGFVFLSGQVGCDTEWKIVVSDRGASIRVPQATVQNNYKGYLEDRRPAAHADPYRIVHVIADTIAEAE